MTSLYVAQVYGEAVVSGDPALKTAQVYSEALIEGDPALRVAQVYAEVMYSPAPATPVQVDQSYVETVLSGTPSARVDQVYVETALSGTPSVRVDQTYIEIVGATVPPFTAIESDLTAESTVTSELSATVGLDASTLSVATLLDAYLTFPSTQYLLADLIAESTLASDLTVPQIFDSNLIAESSLVAELNIASVSMATDLVAEATINIPLELFAPIYADMESVVSFEGDLSPGRSRALEAVFEVYTGIATYLSVDKPLFVQMLNSASMTSPLRLASLTLQSDLSSTQSLGGAIGFPILMAADLFMDSEFINNISPVITPALSASLLSEPSIAGRMNLRLVPGSRYDPCGTAVCWNGTRALNFRVNTNVPKPTYTTDWGDCCEIPATPVHPNNTSLSANLSAGWSISE